MAVGDMNQGSLTGGLLPLPCVVYCIFAKLGSMSIKRDSLINTMYLHKHITVSLVL